MDKIELANCHVTQTTKEGQGKSKWVVKDQEGKELALLSQDLNEHQVMEAIHFARKFELKAWNAGIEFGKLIRSGAKKSELTQDERNKLLRIIDELTSANEVLAKNLDKFTQEI